MSVLDARTDLAAGAEDAEFLPNDGYSSPGREEQDQALEARSRNLVHPIAALEELLLQRPGTAEGERLAAQGRCVGLASQSTVHCFGGAAIVP